jgi:large subunit ribosomal protein L19
MNVEQYVELKKNPRIPDFKPGDSVRVHAKIIEGDRERIQAFEGVVLRIKRGGANSNFTVRRISHGIGVERIFPYYSPLIDRVEVTRVGRVRRAKLYYLRGRVGKAARIKPGSRARFEALTAPGAVMVEEPEVEEGEPTAEEEMLAAEPVPAEDAVEREEGTGEGEEAEEAGEAEEPLAADDTAGEVGEAAAEAPADEAEPEAEEPAPEPAAEAEETVAEEEAGPEEAVVEEPAPEEEVAPEGEAEEEKPE